MGSTASKLQDRTESADFAALLETSFGKNQNLIGKTINGRVVAIDDEYAIIDVGLKSEGRVSLREFSAPGQAPEIRVDDIVEVVVERLEDRDGMTGLSREKARRKEVWADLEQSHLKTERVTGVIFSRVKGGFTVDLGGAVAFLPGSQVDIRPVRDVTPLMGTPQPFVILKMDRLRGNIVVSRRAVLEESREEARSDLLGNIREGSVLEGLVKNITDYGAFIDLGGVDGLLHVTDISWKRINHPSEALQVGQQVTVQVIRYNEETQRISLGMKQLENDPWTGFETKFPVGAVVSGKVTNVTDYGAFIELESGIEGLVHVSEMSWTKKAINPGKLLTVGQDVQVKVIDIDTEKRRISLGIKQTTENPWSHFATSFKVGAEVEGPINNITEFGMFIGLEGDIDGMVHVNDISWDLKGEEAVKVYNKGDTVKVKILDIDADKERVALGIKQLSGAQPEGAKNTATGGSMGHSSSTGGKESVSKGGVVTCTVSAITSGGIEVKTSEGVVGFIKKSDLSRERSEQRPDRFAVGEKIDAKIISVDAKTRKVALSIKARELDEDKAALEAFGSTESGASLGDILGAALKDSSKTSKAKKK
ncbi:MAG: 30S ribosomal protein S1 [Pseudomonadota bacterium]